MVKVRQACCVAILICQVAGPSVAQTANGCVTSVSIPSFTDFLPSAAQTGSVSVIDLNSETLPQSRVTNVFRQQSTVTFAGSGSSFIQGAAIELHASYPNYNSGVPPSPYPTFERHVFGGTAAGTASPTQADNFTVTPYREIYTLTDRGMYLVLASQAGEGNPLASNSANCGPVTPGGFPDPGYCDYATVSGQIWALPKKASDFSTNNPTPFVNAINWINPADPELVGQPIRYAYYRNGFTGSQPVPAATVTAYTYGQISYTPFANSQLQNAAAYFNQVDQTKPQLQIPSPGFNFTLIDVMMVRHYSGCQGLSPSAPPSNPAAICTVFEVHIYGRGIMTGRCGNSIQPLGLIGIIVGTTAHGNGTANDMVNNGFIVYNSN